MAQPPKPELWFWSINLGSAFNEWFIFDWDCFLCGLWGQSWTQIQDARPLLCKLTYVYCISLYLLSAHLPLCWIYYLLHTKISWSTTQRAISNTDWWVWCSEKSPHTIWGPLIGGSNISVSSANRSLDCCQKHDDCMMTAWWLHVSLLRDLGANLNAKHKASWVWPLTHTHTASGPAGSAWMRFHAPVHDETGVDFGCIFELVWFLSSFLMVHIADWGKFKVG